MSRDFNSNWFKKYDTGLADDPPARVNIEVENSIVLIDIESGGSGRTNSRNRTKLLKYVIGRVELFNPSLKVIGYRYGNISNPELAGSRFSSVKELTLVSDLDQIIETFTKGEWYRFRVWLSSDDGQINFDKLLSVLQLIEDDKQVQRNASEAHWPEGLNTYLHGYVPTLAIDARVGAATNSDSVDESQVSKSKRLQAKVNYGVLEALREKGRPTQKKEVVAWVGKNVSFSDYEQELTKGGTVRWKSKFIRSVSIGLTRANLIRKVKNGWWEITDEGRIALSEFEPLELGRFVGEAYKQSEASKKEGSGKSPQKSGRLRNVFEFKAGMPKHKTEETIRKPVEATVVRRRERKLHKILYGQLKEEHGYKNVSSDLGRAWGNCEADLIVQHSNGIDIYEVKSAITSRECVRQALGQLFVYAFWPIKSSSGNDEVLRLIAAGSGKLDSDTKAFLEILNNLLRIPVSYRRIEQKT